MVQPLGVCRQPLPVIFRMASGRATAPSAWVAGRRRRIMVAPKTTRHGIVAIDPYATGLDVALDHGCAGTYNGVPRIVVPYPCGAGRSMQGDQQARRGTQRDNYSPAGGP